MNILIRLHFSFYFNYAFWYLFCFFSSVHHLAALHLLICYSICLIDLTQLHILNCKIALEFHLFLCSFGMAESELCIQASIVLVGSLQNIHRCTLLLLWPIESLLGCVQARNIFYFLKLMKMMRWCEPGPCAWLISRYYIITLHIAMDVCFLYLSSSHLHIAISLASIKNH